MSPQHPVPRAQTRSLLKRFFDKMPRLPRSTSVDQPGLPGEQRGEFIIGAAFRQTINSRTRDNQVIL